MKAIIFSSNQKEDFPMLHSVSKCENGTIITGCLPNHKWQIGQIIESNHYHLNSVLPMLAPNKPKKSRFMLVKEVIEQRDHAGIFSKPEFKNNSYFKLRLSFIDFDDPILSEIN